MKSEKLRLAGNRAGILLIPAFLMHFAGRLPGAEQVGREVSLVTGEAIGELAVAGRLSVELHARFMASRSYGTENVLNWYNCGYSGGGGGKPGVGGTFGDFGMHFPEDERALRYPHWEPVADVPAVRFDGNDLMMGNFPVEDGMAGDGDWSVEIWLRVSEVEGKGTTVLGWQAADGRGASAPLRVPAALEPSGAWRHLVVVVGGGREVWWLDGRRISEGERRSRITAGHRLVLGGAAASSPSFRGSLAAVRLHDAAMAGSEIAHNHRGGPMLGTTLQDWFGKDEKQWRAEKSGHFRHCVEHERIAKWDEKQKREFEERLPGMFRLAELVHHTYTQRLALRSSVVSRRPEKRGDGIKYTIPIQPTDGGNFMGVDEDFGWACQFAGHINPHELVHGFQAQTGGMQGNFWETHANFPQTYNGIYQTMPMVFAEGPCVPSSGRTYYHDRLMFEHLAQTPEYGPMFISKMWYDGPAQSGKDPYPWQVFPEIDPDPSTPMEYEHVRMVQRMVTWDFTTFTEARPGEGNTPFGNDGVPATVSHYREAAQSQRPDMLRFGRVVLEPHALAGSTWRVPRHQAPQQFGWNICPLECKPGKVSAAIRGSVNPARGGAWHAAFVSVDAGGRPTYGDVFPAGRSCEFTVAQGSKELYLVVVATPSRVLPVNMVGDFRSFEQEPFPYQVELQGTVPVQPLDAEPAPPSGGAPHPNGGGFVASTATVAATAYVGADARVTGSSRVLDEARVDGRAEVRDSTVSGRAIVTGRALVMEDSTVTGEAIVADCAVVRRKSTVRDHARVLEHASITSGGTCGGHVTVKGVSNVYGGNQSGTAMIDGFYAKGNDITGGRWLTWSWGKGKNPGETDSDIGPDILKLDFEEPHPWMARDEVGVTWGILSGNPKFKVDGEVERIRETLHEPPGVIQQLQEGHFTPEGHAVVLEGFLLPPATGDYTFWIAADDEGEFRIGEPGGEPNLEVVCSNPFFASATPPAFEKFPSQKSKRLRLQQGKAYPILAVKANSHMGSGLAIAWTRPGSQVREIIGAPHLSVTADGSMPGVARRVWSDVSTILRLTKRPDFPSGKRRESGGVLVLDGSSHVELPRDPTLLREMSLSSRIYWTGRPGERLFEAAGPGGSVMYFTPSEGGKSRFLISIGARTCEVTGPAVPRGVWTEVSITLRGGEASLGIAGRPASRRPCAIRPFELDARSFLLGRGLRGGGFTGRIEHFTVSHPR